MTESFLPLLLVLLGVIGTTLYLDRIAREFAMRPIRIAVQPALGTWDESELDDDGLTGPRGQAQSDVARPELEEARRLSRAGDPSGALAVAQRALAAAPDDPDLTNAVAVFQIKARAVPEAVATLQALTARAPNHYRAWYNLGLASSMAGRRDEARQAYERALAVRPDHLESRINLGLLLLAAQEIPEAITVLRKATESGGNDEKARAFFSYGVALGRAKRTDEAFAAYTKAIELRPDYLLPRYNQAQLLLAQKTPESFERAERILKQATALGPEFAPAWFLLGRLASERGENEDALEMYQAAVRHAPMFFKAAYNAALVSLRLSRIEDAERGFVALTAAFPTRPEPHFNLGRIAYQKRRYVDAEAAYRKAIELQGGRYPEAELNLGLTLKAAGRREDALAVFDALLERAPDMTGAHLNRALVLTALERPDEARAALARAAGTPGGSATADYNLGVLEAKLGRHAEAAAAYQRALTAQEDHLKAAINLAIERRALGELEAAVKAAERATTIAPEYAPAWYNLGVAFRAAGRLTEASDAYRRAVELDPENVKALTNLGATYARQDQFEPAIRTYREALEIAPDNAAARYNLALALKRSGRVDEAVTELEKGRILSPKHSRTANLRASIHLERREWQAAADLLSPFESLPKARPSLLRTLAHARIELGQLDAAAELLERVRGRAPNDPETVDLLSRLARARGVP
jgi:tetratricopeptide (TPR) repeat protein